MRPVQPQELKQPQEPVSYTHLFCHNGSFALNAAKYGAREVTGVDISEEALAVARDNARVNGLDANFEAHNCFDLLRALSDQGEKYDLVILDPPAFTLSLIHI